jgi:hypothetical protein
MVMLGKTRGGMWTGSVFKDNALHPLQTLPYSHRVVGKIHGNGIMETRVFFIADLMDFLRIEFLLQITQSPSVFMTTMRIWLMIITNIQGAKEPLINTWPIRIGSTTPFGTVAVF